jgi:hypothetical protein
MEPPKSRAARAKQPVSGCLIPSVIYLYGGCRVPLWVEGRGMVLISKQSGERTQVRFMPGCLIWSIVLSIVLTVLVNVLIRLF